jgi:hypothetical protein
MMIRITGLVAWYLLVGDVICGTMMSGGVARITVAYPRKFLAHRILGWTLLAAVAVHISSILYQHYKGWGFWQVAIPSPAGPLGRDLGVVATWLLVVILVLAMLKKRIPKRQWHWIHRRVTFVLLALGTAHGLVAGSLSQGTQLPVILPAVVALTLLVSVCLVRANVTATHRRTRHTALHRRVTEKVPLSQRYWPKIAALASFSHKGRDHMGKRTRQERQARSIRIMFGLATVLGISVLILGADQFGATGLRTFVTRQGGVGATPDTKDCGHLSDCSNPGFGGTAGKELAAASVHRHKSRKPTKSVSSGHRRNTLAAGATTAAPAPSSTGTTAAATSRSSTTTPTTERTSTFAAQPEATSTMTPAIRRVTTTTPASTTTTTTPAATSTTTTTQAPTSTTTTTRAPTTTTTNTGMRIPTVSPTGSDRSRPSKASSDRTTGATRDNDRSDKEGAAHATGH